jgi:sigma-E factor negative regulatory protein RseC
MRETGIIVSTQGKIAQVRILRSPQCEGCPGCIDLGKPQERILEADNRVGAAVGARVECDTSSCVVLLHSFLVFLLPLCFMIAGYSLAAHFAQAEPSSSEGPGIAGAFGGLLMAFLLIRAIDRHWRSRHAPLARITGYASEGQGADIPFSCPSTEQINRTTR